MSKLKEEGEHSANSLEKINEDEKFKSSTNYWDEAFIISVILLLLSMAIGYSYYETIDNGLIGICSFIFTLSMGAAKFILPKSKLIMKYLNSEIKKKYLYLAVAMFFFIIIINYVYTPKLYGMEGTEGKIEIKYYNEPKMELDINQNHNEKLKAIFPELAEIRPWCGFMRYKTNGDMTLDFPNETLDGMENYIRLGFQYDNADCESNSGLIIGPLGDYDATEFKSGGLSFLVKGKKGGERFGIGMKDIEGNEFKVDVNNYFIDQNRTTADWNRIFIPLSVFKHVSLSHLDVISLYSNGKMYFGEDYQTIFVANFAFKKCKFC